MEFTLAMALMASMAGVSTPAMLEMIQRYRADAVPRQGVADLRFAESQATGPVKIYVAGDVNIARNGITTANNAPPNLLIYGTVDPTTPTTTPPRSASGGTGTPAGPCTPGRRTSA